MINLKEFKQSILQKAMQGKLTKQLPSDGNAFDLLVKIANKKKILIKNKIIRNHKITPLSKEEIPSDIKIPKNWKWVKIPEISTFPDQNTISPKDVSNDTWVLDLSDIGKDDGIIKRHVTNQCRRVKSSKKVFKKNDVLYGKMNPDLNKVVVADNDGVSSTEIFVIHLLGHIVPSYISYILKSEYFSNLVKAHIKGVMRRCKTTDFKNYPIPLPPLSEQKRIVAKVHKCFELADTIQKERELNKKFAHDMKQSLLTEAMQGKLTKQLPSDGTADELLQKIQQKKQELVKDGKIRRHKKLPPISKDEIPSNFNIPKNWKWVRLNDIGSWEAGSTPNKSIPKNYQGNIPWLRSGDLTDSYVYNTSKTVSKYALHHSSLRMNPVGSIVIAITGATIGKLGILTFDSTTNQHSCACIPYVINNIFLYYYLLSQRYNLIHLKSGSAQSGLSRTKIIHYLIPLPPLLEQKRIVSRLQILFSQL